MQTDLILIVRLFDSYYLIRNLLGLIFVRKLLPSEPTTTTDLFTAVAGALSHQETAALPVLITIHPVLEHNH